MPAAWPFTGGNHQWNCPNRSAFQFYQDAKAAGVELTDLWYGEFPQSPSNINSAVSAIASWKQVVPGLKVMRQLFNQWCFHDRFNDIDTGRFVYAQAESFVQELSTNGYEILWVLMDGPSQRTGGSEPGIVTYWTSYPPINTSADWLTDATWDKIHGGQVESWTRLIDYLKLPGNEAVLAASRGFEAINEPDTYRKAADDTGDIVFAMTKYVQHVLAIYDMLDAAFPGMDFEFYVGGWKFSAELTTLKGVNLPAYGGKSAFDAIRDHVGSRIHWSIHMYSGWITDSNDYRTVVKRIGVNYQPALDAGDPVTITETNMGTELCDDLVNTERRTFIYSRAMQQLAQQGTSFMWWPLFNWAAGRIITARGALPSHSFQNAYGAFMRQGAYNSNPDYMTAADTGIRGPATVINCAVVQNASTDPDYVLRVDDPVTKFAITWGGRGVAVCNPDETANNYQFGGNGRNILYGSQDHDDSLNLGRGGGVARLYGGYSKANACEGENLIYGGSLWSLVTGYTGQMTVVVDPGAETHIVGWSPRKKDKLSFRGALADRADLLSRMTIVQSPNVIYPAERNLVVTFAEGGTLTMWGAASLAGVLDQHVLDFTDGWYAPGWDEPEDYDPADFALPIVDPPPPWPVETSVFGYMATGEAVKTISSSGAEITTLWRSGEPTQV